MIAAREMMVSNIHQKVSPVTFVKKYFPMVFHGIVPVHQLDSTNVEHVWLLIRRTQI
jgi:hypothetical protein